VIPQLTRSSLHRCLQRHGSSRLLTADREKPKQFTDYEIGDLHIDIAELCCEGGKGFRYVAGDRTREPFANSSSSKWCRSPTARSSGWNSALNYRAGSRCRRAAWPGICPRSKRG